MKKDLINRLKQNLEKIHAQQLEPSVQDNEDISPPQVEDPVITTPPDDQIKISTTPKPERPPVVVELPPCHDPCHPETWRRNCQINNTPEPPDDYESQNCPFPNDVRRAQIVKLCETCPESPCLVAPDGRKIYDCETGQFDEALICELARDNHCQTGQLTVAGCPCLNPGNPMGFPNTPTGQSIDCWNCIQYLKPGGVFSYPPQTQNNCSLLDVLPTLDECTVSFLEGQSMDGRCGFSICNAIQCNRRNVGPICNIIRRLSPSAYRPDFSPISVPSFRRRRGNISDICDLARIYDEECRGKAVLDDRECLKCFEISQTIDFIKKSIEENTIETLCECCKKARRGPFGTIIPGFSDFDCPSEIPECIRDKDFPPPNKGYQENVCPDGLFNANDCCCGYQNFEPKCRKKVCLTREEVSSFKQSLYDLLRQKIQTCKQVYTTPSGITEDCRTGQCTEHCYNTEDGIQQIIDFIITLFDRLKSSEGGLTCYILPDGFDTIDQYLAAILSCPCEIEARQKDNGSIVCLIHFRDCDVWNDFTFGRSDCTGKETQPCYRLTPGGIPNLPQVPPPNGPVPPDPATDDVG